MASCTFFHFFGYGFIQRIEKDLFFLVSNSKDFAYVQQKGTKKRYD